MPLLLIVGAALALVLALRGKSAPASMPPGDQGSPAPSTAPKQAVYVPFNYTNRQTGPLIGQLGKIQSSDPGGTSKALGETATYTGYAAKLAALVGQITGAFSAVPVVGVVTSGLSLASAQTAEGKTATAEAIKEAQTESAGASLAIAATTAVAAAVSAVAGLITSGLLLPVAAFFTASSINDSNIAIRRAKDEIRDYKNAGLQLQAATPQIVAASDRLDEFHNVVKLPTLKDQNDWLTMAYVTGANAWWLAGQSANSLSIFSHGESRIGVPGRDVSGIAGMIDTGAQDGFLLWLACKDMLIRRGIPLPGTDPVQDIISGTLSMSGWGGSPALASVMPTDDVAGFVDPSYVGRVKQAPALATIQSVIEGSSGWSLYANLYFWESLDAVRYHGSQQFRRIVAAQIVETVNMLSQQGKFSGAPPSLPTYATVAADLAAVRQAATDALRPAYLKPDGTIDLSTDRAQTEWLTTYYPPGFTSPP